MDSSSVLKEYYARYLKEIRGLSDSSVKHYFDALNNISKRLKDKGVIERDIYEISDYDKLIDLQKILYDDSGFVEYNKRGNHMYSAGLNNYCRFAEGDGFQKIGKKVETFDYPIAPNNATIIDRSSWKRSGIMRMQALELAGYACEINHSHTTFVAENNKPYMEGHHALPISIQPEFEVSLDVYANIVCLCPICHRKIHFGRKDDRAEMVGMIYDVRSNRLAKSGIDLSKSDFVECALAESCSQDTAQ